jgi:hypothetical protein
MQRKEIYMTRRTVGFGFCAIAAFLFASRYFCAAIWGSHVTSWSAELFSFIYSYLGWGLTVAAIAALIVGIAYLIWGESADRQG